MKYLTYQEYSELAIDPVQESDFYRLYSKAESVINILIQHKYRFFPFDLELEWRKEAVQRAIIAQIEYFDETNASTYASLNKSYQSVSLGRTSVSKDSSGSNGGEQSLIAVEAYNELIGTGLLYRGLN